MGIATDISYCDSSLNLEIGCVGCELWNPAKDIRHCYAGVMTEQYAGRNGWPQAFDKPQIFPHRMNDAEKWGDLTGRNRKDKPWLDGMPRVIFLNDMGDTFTKGLHEDWILSYLGRMRKTPHIYLALSKRASKFKSITLPRNVWPMTTITRQSTIQRARELVKSKSSIKGLSIEPMLEKIVLGDIAGQVQWVIAGFESGYGCRTGDWDWMCSLRDECEKAGTAFFVKQGGGVKNHHALLSDLPADLQIRQLPTWVLPSKTESKSIQMELL